MLKTDLSANHFQADIDFLYQTFPPKADVSKKEDFERGTFVDGEMTEIALAEAIRRVQQAIDHIFGEDYAMKNPALVSAMIPNVITDVREYCYGYARIYEPMFENPPAPKPKTPIIGLPQNERDTEASKV